MKHWVDELDSFHGQADLSMLEKSFPGVNGDDGAFRAHLELAVLAVALKRRVVVLQAVEHGQSDDENGFENFIRTLKDDQVRINELEAGVAAVLLRLSTLKITAPRRLRDRMMMRGEVDDLLEGIRRVQGIGAHVTGRGGSDVVVDIARHADGSIDVLPAEAIAAAS